MVKVNKYVGVIIDNNLSWAVQMEKLNVNY